MMTKIVKRPYMRTAPCAVVCRGDGGKVGAIINPDKWPHQGGIAGFGDTLADALRDLAVSIEAEVGWFSKDTLSLGRIKMPETETETTNIHQNHYSSSLTPEEEEMYLTAQTLLDNQHPSVDGYVEESEVLEFHDSDYHMPVWMLPVLEVTVFCMGCAAAYVIVEIARAIWRFYH
jgi:hypothetical protein